MIRETTLDGLDVKSELGAIRAGLNYASDQFELAGDPGKESGANLTRAWDALEKLERLL